MTDPVQPLILSAEDTKGNSLGWANFMTDLFLEKSKEDGGRFLMARLFPSFRLYHDPDSLKKGERKTLDTRYLSLQPKVREAMGAIALHAPMFEHGPTSVPTNLNHLKKLGTTLLWPLEGRGRVKPKTLETRYEDTEIYVCSGGLIFVPKAFTWGATLKDYMHSIDDIDIQGSIILDGARATGKRNTDTSICVAICPELGPNVSAHMKMHILQDLQLAIRFIMAQKATNRNAWRPAPPESVQDPLFIGKILVPVI